MFKKRSDVSDLCNSDRHGHFLWNNPIRVTGGSRHLPAAAVRCCSPLQILHDGIRPDLRLNTSDSVSCSSLACVWLVFYLYAVTCRQSERSAICWFVFFFLLQSVLTLWRFLLFQVSTRSSSTWPTRTFSSWLTLRWVFSSLLIPNIHTIAFILEMQFKWSLNQMNDNVIMQCETWDWLSDAGRTIVLRLCDLFKCSFCAIKSN